jgi:hypothetical protein
VAALAALVALLAAACLTSFAQQAEEVRQGLIGFPARQLRGCIGLPLDVDVRGELEVQTYRWEDATQDRERIARSGYFDAYDDCPPPESSTPHGAHGSGGAAEDPVLDPTAPHPDDPRRRSESHACRRGGARGFPSLGRDEVAYCQLVVEVREGAVTQVTAEGRASNGLNQEARCMLRARDCLPADAAAKD